MVLTQVQKLLSETVTNARVTMQSSGCAETDNHCRPLQVFVPGASAEAERNTDKLQVLVGELGLSVKRIGPRELAVSTPYTPTHVSDETVSF